MPTIANSLQYSTYICENFKIQNTYMNLNKLAEIIDSAAENLESIAQLTRTNDFSLEEAYKIQRSVVKRKLDRGEKLVGIKLGFTSKAKMEEKGLDDLIWGKLTDKMLINRGNTINIKKYIKPKAEPEICFLVKKKIDKELKTIEEAKEYIAGYAVAIEITDTRYHNIQFDVRDTIADNCSAAGMVIGTWCPIEDEIKNLKVKLEINGETVREGNTNAILDNPWESVFNATRLSIAAGEIIPYGAYIMAGAATKSIFLEPGNQVKVTIEQLGEVEFGVRELV